MALTEKVISYKDLGEIRIRKSSSAKRLSITVKPFDGIRVSVPFYLSFKRAEKFIEEKENWLRKSLNKTRFTESQFTLFDYTTTFQTVDHKLFIKQSDNGLPGIKLTDGEIKVFCPTTQNIKGQEMQDLIRRGIEAAWRKEAKKYLPGRLRKLAALNGFEFNKVIIKNNRSRWGSCSNKDNINLSLHMMRLPGHLIDYVLLHELTHTKYRNHSKSFWEHLDKLTGDAKGLDKELKQYRLDIY